MRRRFAVLLLLLSLAVPTFADENARHLPNLRDRVVKIARMILQSLDEWSWPKP
jgi:hypothetical protein